MYNDTFDFSSPETQRTCAEVIHYILMNICKRNHIWYYLGENNDWDYQVKTRFKEADFMDVKWIIDRANFLSCVWYGIPVISSMYLELHCDDHFVPESYRCKENHEETYFLAPADIQILNKVIFRWKLYGRFVVSLTELWYKIKCKLKGEQ